MHNVPLKNQYSARLNKGTYSLKIRRIICPCKYELKAQKVQDVSPEST